VKNLNQVENEKIIPYTLDNILEFNFTLDNILHFTTKLFGKSKSEDMQSVSKLLAYLHHTDVNRGDYHS